MNKDRKDGFYWVRPFSGEWVVGQWETYKSIGMPGGGMWFLPGTDATLYSRELMEIDELVIMRTVDKPVDKP